MGMVECICGTVLFVTVIICMTKILILGIKGHNDRIILFDERDRKSNREKDVFDNKKEIEQKELQIKELKDLINKEQKEKETLRKNLALVHVLLQKLDDKTDLETEIKKINETCKIIEDSIIR